MMNSGQLHHLGNYVKHKTLFIYKIIMAQVCCNSLE